MEPQKKIATILPFDFNQSLDSLIVLLKSNYGEIEISNQHFLEWEYYNNPSGLPAMYIATSEQNEIVGQYLVIPVMFVIDGNKVMGSLSLNTLTREDFRGMGLFTRMANKTFEGCSERDIFMTLGFPNPNSFPGFVKKLSFQHIGNANVLFNPLRPLNIFFKKILNPKSAKYGKDLMQKEELYDFKVSKDGFEISSFNPERDSIVYSKFLESFIELYPTMTYRSTEYLKWRYLDIPTRNYNLLKVMKNGRFLGYCSLRGRQVSNLNSGFIVDICALQDSEANKGTNILIKIVNKYFRKNNYDIIGCMISENSNEKIILKNNWFFNVPKKLLPHEAPLICRINKEFKSSEIVKNISSWFITFGDYDVM